LKWDRLTLYYCKRGIKHAKDYGNDMVIIDTAGRLHIDEELMNELKRIKK
jgi:signal recognition particle subunit SRP54